MPRKSPNKVSEKSEVQKKVRKSTILLRINGTYVTKMYRKSLEFEKSTSLFFSQFLR